MWLVFCKKNAHFSTPICSTPNLEMFPLHCIHKILYAESTDTELIIHAKSFPLWPNTYPQYICYVQTDKWTDERQTAMVPSTPTEQL